MCYEDRDQRTPAIDGGVNGEMPPAGEIINTDLNRSDDDDESSNDFLLAEPALH